MREPQQLYMFKKEATTEKRLLSDRVPRQLQGGQNKRHSQESPPTTIDRTQLLCKLERGQSFFEKCRLTTELINRRFPLQLVGMPNPISTRCNIVLGILKPTDPEA